MFGNCGVGFAPVKKHHRQALMDLMEGVEEIPNPVLAAGLTWEWESVPDFMDALERRERAIDIALVRPSYKALESLPIAEQRNRLRDPELRQKILAEKPSDAEVAKLAQFRQLITKRWDKFFTMGDPPDYEPGPEMSVGAIAARTGRTPESGIRLYHRGESVPLLPGGELRGGRSRADPRNARRPGLPARLERRRRALHFDRRFRLAEFHACALGTRSTPRAKDT
jgi:N-acyl-D-aspartate/D-glutamate deacylase